MKMLTGRLLAGAGTRGPICLVYHSIEQGARRPAWRWALSARDFTAQLDLLRDDGWSTVRVSDLVPGGHCPEKTIAITFDDGYLDNLPAIAELERRGMCATWFIVSDHIGASSAWVAPNARNRPLLDLQTLREMCHAGMEIGSHTRSHRDLTTLADGDLAEELSGSKARLEDLLGTAVRSLAYPYGIYDPRVVAAARSAGYAGACTTRSGVIRHDDDVFQMRRISITHGDTAHLFARKLAFADNEVGNIRLLSYFGGRILHRLRG